MTLEFTKQLTQNPANILRKCGYFANFDPVTGHNSFIRRLSGGRYPRFHIYILKEGVGFLQLNLHLDMKKESYGDQTAHSGEYDTEVVDTEATRIGKMFTSHYVRHSDSAVQIPQKKSFWRRIFGL
ncbi:MAG: Uncharacterized protein G01um101418_126 [Parcubacteria group bacterium Gr01-1014_18]|nr:MAG: Uncharacterized protein Greene041636_430 [Parcubacteria group bacterium Greene0416_36]TSC81453.1 MAG: Uncharacterized protein G01um101418_126 [Parcubacteria group bacterium Gr01-1014_18]TSC99051.1 MAG: Uncharacterized protein Greene101420_407 [Parcubacteria group bacterium Greene1014_20]TSD07268.1 MAG: Uncharacterized protein Greene07142_284 [Parcubacteria group bacterium Greene0714_2]